MRFPHTYMAYPLNMNHTCRPAALDLYESMAMAKVFATMKKAMSISNLCVCVCVCVCVVCVCVCVCVCMCKATGHGHSIPFRADQSSIKNHTRRCIGVIEPPLPCPATPTPASLFFARHSRGRGGGVTAMVQGALHGGAPPSLGCCLPGLYQRRRRRRGLFLLFEAFLQTRVLRLAQLRHA